MCSNTVSEKRAEKLGHRIVRDLKVMVKNLDCILSPVMSFKGH